MNLPIQAEVRLQGMPGYLQDVLPQVTALRDGGFVVAWSGETSDAQGSDVFLQQFSLDGAMVGHIVRLQGLAGNLHDFSPQVGELPDGGFVVTWVGRAQFWPDRSDIFVQRFGGDGAKDGNMALLQGLPVDAANRYPQVASLSDGGFVVTWQVDQAVFVQAFDLDGALAGDLIHIQGMTGSRSNAEPQIAALDDGGFVVVWKNETTDWQGSDIFVQQFSANGVKASEIIRLQGMPGFLGDWAPSISALTDGGFVVTWQGETSDGQAHDIFVQRFNADGAIAGEMSRLQGMAGSLWDSSPQVSALLDGGFVVTWAGETSDGQGHDIFVQRFDADGAIAGEMSRLQGGEGNLWDNAPAVGSMPDGGFVVAWSGQLPDGQSNNIFLQRFDVGGAKAGDMFQLQSMVGSRGDDAPQISVLSDGGFVVTWYAQTSDGQAADIFVQAFDANGEPIVTERNNPASIMGDLTGMVVENDPERQLVTGVLTVTDTDAGEDRFQAPDPATLQGTFGSFTFDPETGAWSYTLDDDADAVQALPEGEQVTDSLTVTSLDGTASETITVTVTGTGVRDDTPPEPEDTVVLAGAVVDRAGNELVGTSVTFTPDGGGNAGVDTDASGRFSFELPVGSTGHLDAARGHGAGDPSISTASALEALRMAVGLNPSWGAAEPMDFIAADFNGDGRVTTADALGILRVAVGLTAEQAPRWLFVDSDADLSEVSRSNTHIDTGLRLDPIAGNTADLSLTGILIGHVQEYA